MTATAIKLPLNQRINLRMVTLAVVALIIIGYPVYIYINESVTQGIHRHSDFTEVDLKAMSNFEMDQTNGSNKDVPAIYRNLDGQKVALEGEMYETNTASDQIPNFQLVYSIAKCCFQGTKKVQHFVDSKVVGGRTVYHYSGLVRVLGTLHVDVKRDDVAITSVYQLDVDSVEPK